MHRIGVYQTKMDQELRKGVVIKPGVLIAIVLVGLSGGLYLVVDTMAAKSESERAEKQRSEQREMYQREYDSALAKKYLIELDNLIGVIRTPEEQERYQELANELSLLVFNADGIDHKLIDRYDHSGNAIPNETIVHKEALKAINEALSKEGK